MLCRHRSRGTFALGGIAACSSGGFVQSCLHIEPKTLNKEPAPKDSRVG